MAALTAAANAPFAAPATVAYPARGAAWFLLVLLLLAYTSSFVCRQVISLVVQPIRSDLGVSDTQISLLQGISFALFYSVLGIPLGLLADRWSRRNLIIVGLVLWTIATALCGLADSFWTLFIARMGIGIGEAALAPAAYSLIADSFAPAARGRPMALYTSGAYLGAGLAFAGGGSVLPFADRLASSAAGLHGWQIVFLLAGVPGLVLPLLFLLVREPIRQGRIAARRTVGLGACIRMLLADRAWFGAIIAAMTLLGVINYSYFAWVAAAFQRAHGWAARDIGQLFGILLFVLGPIGMALAGLLTDRLPGRTRRQAALTVTIGGVALTTPCALLTGLAPDAGWALAGLAGYIFFMSMTITLGPMLVQMTLPNEFRGVTISIYLLIQGVAGLGFGPTIAALISDRLFHDETKIGVALGVMSAVMLPAALAMLLALARHLRRTEPVT